jgi:hypothetical protein
VRPPIETRLQHDGGHRNDGRNYRRPTAVLKLRCGRAGLTAPYDEWADEADPAGHWRSTAEAVDDLAERGDAPVELPEIHPLHVGVGACTPRAEDDGGDAGGGEDGALGPVRHADHRRLGTERVQRGSHDRLVAVDLERLADERRVQLGVNRRTACGDLVQQGGQLGLDRLDGLAG